MIIKMIEVYLDAQKVENLSKNDALSWYDEENRTVEVTFIYPSDFLYTKFLRTYFQYIWEIIDLNGVWTNRFILVLEELNNNAIEYGSKNSSWNRCCICIKRYDTYTEVMLEVEDSWDGKYAKKACDMEKIREERKNINYAQWKSIRGRGLFLMVQKIVDTLYFKDSERGWLIVWIYKKLPTEG